MKKLYGLGKGLSSLIPQKKEVRSDTGQPRENVFYIETNKIKPNPKQPRRKFGKDGIKELAASIKKYGMLQPVLVVKIQKTSNRGLDVEYHLLAGERRWRAARSINLPSIPAVVKDSIIEDRVKLELALTENLQREDLNPMEEALAYKRFSEEFGLTQKQIAEKVFKSREVVANALRFFDLPLNIQESLRVGKVSKSQARALLAFKDGEKQKEIYRQMLAGMLSVREAEREAKEEKNKNSGGENEKKIAGKFENLEKNLSENMGVPVFIKAGSSGGKILIKFLNLEELNNIAKKILG